MRELDQNDFFQGLFAGLALRGVQKVSIRTDNFDPVIRRVFERLESVADERHIELDFDIIPDPTHRDSLTIRDALATCASDGLISYDNPEYQDIELKLGPHGANVLLDQRLPDLKDVFEDLATLFVENYYAAAPAA